MPMNTLRTALLALVVAAAFRAAAQPVYTFRVKVGIDRESVDSLGGRDRVVQLTEDMFRRVNRAFNYGAQLRAVYDFVVDWDAFYIYDGVSADQIRKPHPDHDYLVVMDGYKSDPRETGGGWYGDGIQAIYHSRTHNDRFNSPFEKNAIDGMRKSYDYILIDCMPSLGMMTVNALVAADSVIIPSQPNFLSTKGLNLLLRSISKIKRQINPRLKIDGILLTMVDNRTNNAKAIISSLRSTVGENIRVFRSEIPFSVRAAECSLSGESIFSHDRNGKVAAAYEALTKEVTELEERAKNRSGPDRVR